MNGYLGAFEWPIRHGVVASKRVSVFWPAELAEILWQRDLDPLVDRAELNPEQAEKVVTVLGTEEALMELEAVELLDRPQIELQDGQTYNDCAMLATGQKCAAILPVLLLDSDRPLLVDQPEDNLDNRFIFETVVEVAHYHILVAIANVVKNAVEAQWEVRLLGPQRHHAVTGRGPRASASKGP